MLSDPDAALALVKHCVPSAVLNLLADEPPELLGESFVDAELRRSQCDLLFKLALRRGTEVFAYFVIEHKSGAGAAAVGRADGTLSRWQAFVGTGRVGGDD